MRMRTDTDPAKVKPVSVPARLYGYICDGPSVAVFRTRQIEKLKV
jgi:hypothetical protein